MVLTGAVEPVAWNRAARQYDLDDAKGLLELLFRRLGLAEPSYVADARGFPFHPGRALVARRESGGEAVAGRVAELHPDAVAAWDLRAQRVIVAEIAVAGLDSGALARVHVEPIPHFPEVERDLAVIVAQDRTAAEVEATIEGHGGLLLRRLRLFDVYRGAPLDAGQMSLAYRLVLGASDRTLTEAEVDAAIEAVRGGLEADLGAHLRS